MFRLIRKEFSTKIFENLFLEGIRELFRNELRSYILGISTQRFGEQDQSSDPSLCGNEDLLELICSEGGFPNFVKKLPDFILSKGKILIGQDKSLLSHFEMFNLE